MTESSPHCPTCCGTTIRRVAAERRAVGKAASELSRLGLSAGEREDLVAFLWSLTGERPAAPLLTTPLLAPPAADLGSERGH